MITCRNFLYLRSVHECTNCLHSAFYTAMHAIPQKECMWYLLVWLSTFSCDNFFKVYTQTVEIYVVTPIHIVLAFLPAFVLECCTSKILNVIKLKCCCCPPIYFSLVILSNKTKRGYIWYQKYFIKVLFLLVGCGSLSSLMENFWLKINVTLLCSSFELFGSAYCSSVHFPYQ